MVIINVYIYLFKVSIFEKKYLMVIFLDRLAYCVAPCGRNNVTECSKNNRGLRQRMLD